MSEKLPIACDLTVFTAAERAEHTALAARIFGEAIAIEEASDGYVLRYADRPGLVRDLGVFVEDDRRCCPFLTFAVCVGPAGIALAMDGPPAAKAALGEGLRMLREGASVEAVASIR